jgi:hypothetical protein
VNPDSSLQCIWPHANRFRIRSLASKDPSKPLGPYDPVGPLIQGPVPLPAELCRLWTPDSSNSGQDFGGLQPLSL